MTEGRFETIHNLRPKNWDARRHWTNWHHLYDCERDHLARESCPFHDLRSGGQFQYENWGGGEFKPSILPGNLNNRPCGDRMDFLKGPGTQIGGLGNIPLDVEGGRPTEHNKHPGKTVLYTKKSPLNRGLFSSYPYIPEPPGGTSEKRGTCPNMKAGKADAFGRAPEWIAEPYNGKADRGRIFHFKAGPTNLSSGDQITWMPDGEPEKRKKRPHGVFRAGKPCGPINDTEWIPEPFQEGGVKKHSRPFRTWHTRTKWSMPVSAPWSTGKITAEPFQGPTLNIAESGLPRLDTFKRVNMTQTIGKEAALASMKQPEPARLK